MSERANGDVSDRLVDHVLLTPFEDLPFPTAERTKQLVLDTLGAALAARTAEGCAELHELVVRWGGARDAGLIGFPERVPAHHAALLNATLARALELDDVHELGLTHSTATMVPVALAVADRCGRTSGREFLTAVALGIDLGCRLSMTPISHLGGSDYQPRSMSRTYQTGTLAGSLVAARLAGLDAERARDAFGAAYSQCAGNLQGLAEGTLTVRVQQGMSAQAAVLAAELAEVGISGTRESLEGKYGWFQAFWGGRYDLALLLDGLGTRFEVDAVSVKPYACCKYSHTAIAAAIEIANDPAFHVDQVERVVVHVFSRDCWDLICEPLDVKASPAALRSPNGWAVAQFSLPYAIACALVRGGLTIDELTIEARTDAAILEVLDKVEVLMEDTTRTLAELPEPGQVEVYLRSGQCLEHVVRRAIGHPDRPMTVDEQVAKFQWCARSLPGTHADRIVELVLGLDELDDVLELAVELYGAP